MASADAVDVLVVSVAGTIGWTRGARELADGLARAGARVVQIEAARPRDVRTLMLTDLREAYAARRAARRGIARYHPRAILYCSTTSALLWPRPGGIWLDATASVTGPGATACGSGRSSADAWPRLRSCSVGRRRRSTAPVTCSAVSRPSSACRSSPRRRRQPPAGRDLAAVAYIADPVKRRLDLTLAAWAQARRDGETLVVAGIDGADAPGVRFAGRVEPAAFRALLRRARVFLATPLVEEYGIAALEALADGAQLVTTPAAGAYPALALASELDPRLVARDHATSLAAALRAALDEPLADYATRAAGLLAPYRRSTMSAVLATCSAPARATMAVVIPSRRHPQPGQQRLSHRAAVLPRVWHRVRLCGRRAAIISRVRWSRLGGDPELPLEIAMWAFPGGLIGGRIYFDITTPSQIPPHWWGSLAIWDGGLGIWGGVAGGVITGLWVARRRLTHAQLLQLMDVVGPALLVSQSIGRIGNYFNQELFGRPSSLPWALKIAPEHRPPGYAHYATFEPTFLYEIVWNLLLFASSRGCGVGPRYARPACSGSTSRATRASGSSRRPSGSTTRTTSWGCG